MYEQIAVDGGAQLHGKVHVVPSKSHTHRALIAASLSSQKSRIRNPSSGEDVEATINAIRAYGTEVTFKGDNLEVVGPRHIALPEDVLHCGESGSTMRFVGPVLSHAEGISVLTGGVSLRRRPMHPLISSLGQLGVRCYSVREDGRAPLVIFGGTYKGGITRIRGDISSQFISGLLFSAPLASRSTSIEVTTMLESAPYVRMTLEILKCHGIEVDAAPKKFLVPGGQSANYNPAGEHDFEKVRQRQNTDGSRRPRPSATCSRNP